MANIENKDNPGYRSAAYMAQKVDVDLCRDVYEGTRALRSSDYLIQFPKETDEAYQRRVEQSVLFNAYRKTVKGLTGMVFRKDPTLNDPRPEVESHWENIDLAGRHGVVFARDIFEAKAIDGHTHILVDWRDVEGARVRAEEDGARPFWVHITKSQVIRWRTANIRGETVLTRFAYMETDTEATGEYSDRSIIRVRQYDLTNYEGGGTPVVEYQSWVREDNSRSEWVQEVAPESMGERMTRIPVVTDYADREGFMRSRPPLLDLAFENVRHFQLRSDRDNLLRVSHVPILLFTGTPKEKVENATVGAGVAIVLEGPEATGEYLEASGSGLEQSATELEAIENRMAALGLAMLVRRDRVQRTATEAAGDKAEQDSDLAAMARGTQDAMDEALALHGMWLGVDEPGTVAVNKDFVTQTIDPQVADVLLKMVSAGWLSVETLWDRLIAGEVLDDTFDPKLEMERIEEQGAESLMAARTALQRAAGGGEGDDGGEELPEAA